MPRSSGSSTDAVHLAVAQLADRRRDRWSSARRARRGRRRPSRGWRRARASVPIDPLGHRRVRDPDDLAGHPGRVGERAEEVERGRDAELLAHRAREAHRGVEPLREAERDARLLDAAHHARRARGRSTTPSSSSRSAEPHADDAARLPCLATRTPAPAITSAATVEMLNVCDRSPPVPHVSTSGPAGALRVDRRPARRTAASCARARRARPGVSPFARSSDGERARSARRSPSPSRIVAIAASTSRRVEVLPAQAAGPGRPARRTPASVLGHRAQSHQRSWSSTPLAMSPSCTWLVPSTIVSCFASR